MLILLRRSDLFMQAIASSLIYIKEMIIPSPITFETSQIIYILLFLFYVNHYRKMLKLIKNVLTKVKNGGIIIKNYVRET